MKIRQTPLAAVVVAVAMGAPLAPAAAAEPAGRTYAPGPFDRLQFSGAANVRFVQGDRDELFIEGDEATLQGVQVVWQDGRLAVSQTGPWRFWTTPRLQMRVVARDLRQVVVSGAADFVAPEAVQLKNLEIQISGAGLANFHQLNAERLRFIVSGSGEGKFAGTVADLQLQISGRGDFVAPRLQAQVARVTVSGLGRVKVWATEELNATLSGVGSIEYWGNPSRGNRRLSGVGSLQPRGETPPP